MSVRQLRKLPSYQLPIFNTSTTSANITTPSSAFSCCEAGIAVVNHSFIETSSKHMYLLEVRYVQPRQNSTVPVLVVDMPTVARVPQ